MTIKITIREAQPEDSKDIWIWRHDKTTREMSISTDAVDWDSHSDWFETSLLDKNTFLYIGFLESDKSKVGICRYNIDPEKNVARVSINLNPEKRGQGLSCTLLAGSMEMLFREKKIDLTATIKKHNKPSITCFTKCGFKFDSEDSLYNHYVFHNVL